MQVWAFGYQEVRTGKTAGSRVAFIHSETQHIIKLHRPHPRPVLKRCQLYQLDYHENGFSGENVATNPSPSVVGKDRYCRQLTISPYKTGTGNKFPCFKYIIVSTL